MIVFLTLKKMIMKNVDSSKPLEQKNVTTRKKKKKKKENHSEELDNPDIIL